MAFVRDCCPAYEERRRRSRRRVCRAVTPRGCPGWGACGAWCSCGCARWIAAHRKLQAVAGRLHPAHPHAARGLLVEPQPEEEACRSCPC